MQIRKSSLEDVFIELTGRGCGDRHRHATPGRVGCAAEVVQGPSWAQMARSFGSLLRRDVVVTGKDLIAFVAQVLLRPVFFLFVFGKLLTGRGYTSSSYPGLLFPGLVA